MWKINQTGSHFQAVTTRNRHSRLATADWGSTSKVKPTCNTGILVNLLRQVDVVLMTQRLALQKPFVGFFNETKWHTPKSRSIAPKFGQLILLLTRFYQVPYRRIGWPSLCMYSHYWNPAMFDQFVISLHSHGIKAIPIAGPNVCIGNPHLIIHKYQNLLCETKINWNNWTKDNQFKLGRLLLLRLNWMTPQNTFHSLHLQRALGTRTSTCQCWHQLPWRERAVGKRRIHLPSWNSKNLESPFRGVNRTKLTVEHAYHAWNQMSLKKTIDSALPTGPVVQQERVGKVLNISLAQKNIGCHYTTVLLLLLLLLFFFVFFV